MDMSVRPILPPPPPPPTAGQTAPDKDLEALEEVKGNCKTLPNMHQAPILNQLYSKLSYETMISWNLIN